MTDPTSTVLPYRAWWGLVGCGVLMALVMLFAPYSTFEIQERAFTFDYPWKLPEPTYWTRTLVWSLYALHQIGIWYLIYKAQSMKLSYVEGLHKINLQALGLNAGFVLLHLLQTKLTYDGLAQDVHEVSALASVALMLFFVLLMENDRRGLFFGKKVPFPKGVGPAVRKYHGYYFSWAITYTFWYHPFETTPGHLMGFFYMFMLFLQGSLFMTTFHVNRWWTLTLEFFMTVHGTTVALAALGSLEESRWSHFLFGGLAVLVITQMHGVPFKRWHKWVIGLTCLFFAAWYYALNPDKLADLPGTFLSRYIAVVILVGLIWMLMRPLIWTGKMPKAFR